jgi:hypothetical protein
MGRTSSGISFLGILLATLNPGCACEGVRQYRGTVTVHDRIALSVDEDPNPSGRPPIPGATVWLVESKDVAQEVCEAELLPATGPYGRASTDAQGLFIIDQMVIAASEYDPTLCIAAAGYRFYYVRLSEVDMRVPRRPGQGDYTVFDPYLNISLPPVSSSPSHIREGDRTKPLH